MKFGLPFLFYPHFLLVSSPGAPVSDFKGGHLWSRSQCGLKVDGKTLGFKIPSLSSMCSDIKKHARAAQLDSIPLDDRFAF